MFICFSIDQTGRWRPEAALIRNIDLDRITGFFCFVGLYPVDPVDPVRKINRPFDTGAHDGPFDKEAHDGQNTLLRHSIFLVRCSIFAFSKLLFRLNRPLVRPAAVLIAETPDEICPAG